MVETNILESTRYCHHFHIVNCLKRMYWTYSAVLLLDSCQALCFLYRCNNEWWRHGFSLCPRHRNTGAFEGTSWYAGLETQVGYVIGSNVGSAIWNYVEEWNMNCKPLEYIMTRKEECFSFQSWGRLLDSVTQDCIMHDFRLLPWSRWYLHSAGILCSVEW